MALPVILDCDPGHDDALALILALASPELKVLAVTTSAGNQTAAALIATDTTRVWGPFMSGNTTTVINYGGHVLKDPLPGNPNHCLINGLKLGQIKGMWH